MKKLVKLLLVGLMSLTCVACGNNNDKENQVGSDQLIKEGELVVGISPDYPPYETIDENGNMVGFDVDMAEELGKIMGVKIVWEQMAFDTIVDAVNLGQVDCGIAGFTYDPERQVLFSDYYLKSKQVVLVKVDAGITTTADLNGKYVGAQLGTTGENCANDIEGATVETNKDAKLLVESLKASQLDAVVIDVLVAQNYVANDSSLTILDETLLDEENGIITSTTNELLMDKLNEAIATFKASDAYNTLKNKWGM